MKKNYLLSLLLFLASNCFAQITFQKIIRAGAECAASSVQQTTDGGYIITGYIGLNNDSNSGVYLIKTNGEGDTLWTKTFGGKYQNYGNFVQQTTDGGFIVAGIITNYDLIQDAYIMKTDVSGDTLWTKAYTLGGRGSSYSSIQQTRDSGYIVIGSCCNSGTGCHVTLLKINANGDSTWNKTYGGTRSDEGYSVKQTSDGGYILCGNSNSFGPGSSEVYVIKTNGNGDIIWTKAYGENGNDYGAAVQQTTDDGYIICGTTSFGAGGSNAYLIKTNGDGDTLWTKTYGGTDGVDIHQTFDGGYIICGSDMCLIKTDSLGDILWTKAYVGINSQEGSSCQQTADGGYVMAGLSTGFDTLLPLNQIYLIKTDSNGNSGCYESNTNTIAGYAPFPVASVNTIIYSGNMAESATVTIIGSGGTDSTLCLTVGYANESVNNTISLYPNPTDGKLYIKNYQQTVNSYITITNVLGQVVKPQTKSPQMGNPIDVSHLAADIYFLQLKTESGVSTMKFVKE